MKSDALETGHLRVSYSNSSFTSVIKRDEDYLLTYLFIFCPDLFTVSAFVPLLIHCHTVFQFYSSANILEKLLLENIILEKTF